MSDQTVSDRRIVRVAAVQIAPDLDTPGGTLRKVCDAIDEAAGKGARLVVFPETFVPYYPYFSFVRPPVQSGRDTCSCTSARWRCPARSRRRWPNARAPAASWWCWG
ncbi:hypothetical protein GCM10023144_36380 [Pigmentiphaga soli]|uniref:CN hydrolase domain-containing protein n=1 Tax=Pigmentiphaga soli TaxID=1007095 RepID=A0ABP8HG08_9BURK